MGFSEALSDTGELTGRGSPWSRAARSPAAARSSAGSSTRCRSSIADYHVALFFAIVVVGFELLTLAYLRWRFFQDTFVRALGS